jgi:SAM-dependent methyltransferase
MSAPRSQQEHFDRVASRYDHTIPAHVMGHLTRRRVDLAQSLAPRGRVLDVGCGIGTFLRALPDRYDKVGVDISHAMLEVASSAGLSVTQAGGGELPFEDASFDLVSTFAVLHHLIDRTLVRETIGEMCRVAKLGGAVIVWDHNPLNPYWPILMRRLPQDRGDERLVPARLIRQVLNGCGMTHVHLRRMTFIPDFTPRWGLPIVKRIEPLMERIPALKFMAAHNVFTARRCATN